MPNRRVVATDDYHVDGHAYSFPMYPETKQTVCTDFKALKLVRWDTGKKVVVEEDWRVALRVLLAQLGLRM